MTRTRCCVLAFALTLAIATGADARSWPSTNKGVHVFNDQLAAGLSDAQVRFAARHYAGTQKLTASEARRYRQVNPGFLVLHYRLGLALGYRLVEADCQPSGPFISIIDGDWRQEWPGDTAEPAWFFTWEGERVFNCDWGWYLVDPDNPGFRGWWAGELASQLRANDDDGLFLDSMSVPNYLGAGSYRPRLPDADEEFEAAWSERIARLLDWLHGRPDLSGTKILPNVGSWITSRERTDYGPADGMMVEGFAMEADRSPYARDDWLLQMDRILGQVTGRGKILLAQNYVSGNRERTFTVASYLLVKGERSFLNIDRGEDPEWWPEYDLPVGRPAKQAGGGIESLRSPHSPVLYERRFRAAGARRPAATVYVNPTSPFDGTAETVTVPLSPKRWLAATSGGGDVNASGRKAPQRLSYRRVGSLSLSPAGAAIVFDRRPRR